MSEQITARPYHKNPRKISAQQVVQLREWLAELGDLGGIVHDLNSGEIISGNQRSFHAFDLAQCEIEITHRLEEPDAQGTVAHGFVLWQGGRYAYRQVRWTAEQCEKANIIANKAGGVWDIETLLSDFEREGLLAWGFSDEELDDLAEALADEYLAAGITDQESQDAEPQVNRAEELRAEWGVELGQMWRLPSRTEGQEHRLICGDCTDAAVVERVMGGENAEAAVTDAPYGQNQAGVFNDEPEKHKGLIEGCFAVMPCDGVVVGFQSPRTFPVWLDALRKFGQTFERMLWMYKAAQMTYPWRGWLLTSEAILISSGSAPVWNDINPNAHDCYYLSEVSGELGANSGWHGSVKPLSVVSDLLSRVSTFSGLIYEPFSGSGTTIIAAENLSRQCRAVEISPAYVAVALQRYQDAFGITPELIEDASW